MNAIVSISAFAVLTGVWLTFLAALLWKQELLSRTWRSFRSAPLLAQIFVVLLALPVVLGLAIWETRWPALLRLALVLGLAWVTVYTFFPQSIG